MLRIGALELGFPVVQAALAGYSDGPMRIIARGLGAPYALREAVLDRNIAQRGRLQRRLLAAPDPRDHPLGGQLLGARPDEMGAAAALLAAHGCDVIDVNFGCPVRKVLGRCRGGWLLSQPEVACAILRAVRAAVPRDVPVTVKLRRGMDDTAESERKFFRILEAAFALGLAAVTVHPRTVAQRYRGPSDWRFLARVKRHAGRGTVLGSGDLFSADDIRRMLAETGVDGVSVARGCIGNPWIFREARALLSGNPWPEPPSVAEQGRVIRAHLDLAIAAHGEVLGCRRLRKSGIRYADLHPYGNEVRAAYIRARTVADWRAILDRWYDPGRDWPAGIRGRSVAGLVAAGAGR